MTIAELFVNIGVKGAENAKKALGGISEGMGGIASSSLAAKAAVLAVIYGAERFMSTAAESGMQLKQFSAFTGLSTDALQRWQYAARQSGVSAEEMAGSIKGVQSAIGQMQLGKGPPGGIGIIAQYTGGFDRNKINDTFYLFDKLKQFAKNKAVPTQFGNEFLKSFGLSENVIQFLRSTNVELDKIKPSNIFSSREIDQLARVDVAWLNFWNTLKLFQGHVTATVGLDAVKMLSSSFDFLSTTTANIIKFTKTFPILKDVALAAAAAISVAYAPIAAIIAGITYSLSEIQKYRDGKQSVFGENGMLPEAAKAPERLMNYLSGDGFMKDISKMAGTLMGSDAVVPAMGPVQKPTAVPNNTVFNTKVVHSGDPKDTKEIEGIHKKVIRDAARQLQSQKQVN